MSDNKSEPPKINPKVPNESILRVSFLEQAASLLAGQSKSTTHESMVKINIL